MEQMPIVALFDAIGGNLALAVPILLLLLGAIVVYLVFMVRAIIEMLRYEASSVLLVFSFVALVPFPLILILGILILIIWHYHKPDLLKRAGSQSG